MTKWLVALLVLAGLLVGADRIAEQVAEGVVADQLARDLGGKPTVEVGGFPFLTQAATGRYGDITVRADEVDRGGVRVHEFHADLRGAHLSPGDALSGSARSLPVDRLTATGLVSYPDLTAAARAQQGTAQQGLTLAPEGDAVRIDSTVRVGGRQVPLTALADLALDGDTLLLTTRQLQLGGEGAQSALSGALAGTLTFRVPAPALPYGLHLAGVQATGQGVRVRAQARDTVLRP